MMDGIYRIEVDNPMVNRAGTVKLHENGDKVNVEINMPIIGKQRVVGQREGENSFSVQGVFRMFLLGKVNYLLQGEVEGDALRGGIKSSKGDIKFAGTRVSG